MGGPAPLTQPLYILRPSWEEGGSFVLDRPEPDFLFHSANFFPAWAWAEGTAHHVYVRQAGLSLFGQDIVAPKLNGAVEQTVQQVFQEQGEWVTPLAWALWARERVSVTVPEQITFFGWSLNVCDLPLLGRFCGASVFTWWEYHLQLIYQASPVSALAVVIVLSLLLQGLLAWWLISSGTGPDIAIPPFAKQEIQDSYTRPPEIRPPPSPPPKPPPAGAGIWGLVGLTLAFFGLGVVAAAQGARGG